MKKRKLGEGGSKQMMTFDLRNSTHAVEWLRKRRDDPDYLTHDDHEYLTS